MHLPRKLGDLGSALLDRAMLKKEVPLGELEGSFSGVKLLERLLGPEGIGRVQVHLRMRFRKKEPE